MLAGIPAVDQCEQGLPPAMRSRCNKAAHTQAPLAAARELQGYIRTLRTAGFEARLDAHRCVALDREAVDESENASVATRAANDDRLASRPPHNLRPRFSRQGLPRRDLLLSNFCTIINYHHRWNARHTCAHALCTLVSATVQLPVSQCHHGREELKVEQPPRRRCRGRQWRRHAHHSDSACGDWGG